MMKWFGHVIGGDLIQWDEWLWKSMKKQKREKNNREEIDRKNREW